MRPREVHGGTGLAKAGIILATFALVTLARTERVRAGDAPPPGSSDEARTEATSEEDAPDDDDDDDDGLPPVRATTRIDETRTLGEPTDDEIRPPPPPTQPDASDARTEVAAFPIIAGNSDIGVQFGGAGFLTRLAPGAKPYAWKGDILLSMSLKPGPGGSVDIAQQQHDIRFDFPKFLGTKVRVMPGLFVERHVNSGYFGLGNASQPSVGPDGSFGRRNQAIVEEAKLRVNVRVPIKGPFDAMFGLQIRYTDATAYAGSKLEEDARATDADGRPLLLGMDPTFSLIPAAGIVYDTRDNEISPRRGAFDVFGVRAGGAWPSSREIGYGGGSIVLRRYIPAGPIVLAGRVVADVIVGRAPFYDLTQGVTFTPTDLIGGLGGLRGVPNGRYTGKVKMFTTAEARALLFQFTALKQRFRVGTQAFVDVGRIFSDLSPEARLDGTGLGLKYGVGGGAYFIWGEAAVIRMEIAYSPDARSANEGLPIGFYIADGHAF